MVSPFLEFSSGDIAICLNGLGSELLNCKEDGIFRIILIL